MRKITSLIIPALIALGSSLTVNLEGATLQKVGVSTNSKYRTSSFMESREAAEVKQFELGYVDPNTQVQNQNGIGNFESSMKVGFAIKLPKEMLSKYVGAKVVAVKMGWSTTSRSDKASAFITTMPGGKPIEKTRDIDINFGWNTIKFENGYVIPADVEDLFFGYYTNVGAAEYPIAAQFWGKKPNSCFAWKEDQMSNGKELWADMFDSPLGMPLIKVVFETESGKFENMMSVSNPKFLEIQSPGQTAAVYFDYYNYGVNKVSNYTVQTTFDGKSTERTINLEKPYPANSGAVIALPLTLDKTGLYEYKVIKVNGKENAIKDNSNLYFYSIPEKVSAKYKRKLFIELFTSESSYNWPDVNDTFFKPSIEQCEVPFTIVSHHMGDQFMVKDDEASKLSLKMCNDDSSKVYEYEVALDRTFNPQLKGYYLLPNEGPKIGVFNPQYAVDNYNNMSAIPSCASVIVSNKVEDNKLHINVSGDVNKTVFPNDEQYYLTVYVTQDSIISDSQDFPGGSDKNKSLRGDGKDDVVKGEYRHDYVVRSVATDIFGDLLNLDENGTYHMDYELKIKKSWDLPHMKVVAVVHRAMDKGILHMEVLNSNDALIGQVSSSELLDGSGMAVVAYQDNDRIAVHGEYRGLTVYNMLGQEVANENLQKGAYIVKVDMGDRSVVKKVWIR